jgi:16S rRNA (cytidine1402-2'-O)-methyltransferase
MPFHIVSTPIGNLGDISYRAVEVLKAADVILAEDTRRSSVLLRHYGISGRLISAHEHNEAARAGLVVELLREGKEVALITDAGTPLLSDPGARLVASAVEAGFEVIPVPGASALLAALVVSGLAADRFTFLGFIPRKGGDRGTLLQEIARSPYTSILYESPNRTEALVRDLLEVAGPDRRIAVAREITKLHEEVYRATLGEAAGHFAGRELRGEIVVVVSGSSGEAESPEESIEAARALAATLLEQGIPPSAAAKELRQRLRLPRNEAYQLVQELASEE